MSTGDDAAAAHAGRSVDAVALTRSIARIEHSAEPPWLHAEAARRMAERLVWIKRKPAQVVDWWSATSASVPLLSAAYPKARILPIARRGGRGPLEADAPVAPWWSPRRWQARSAGLAWISEDDVPAGAAELVWANMGLHFVLDPQQQMRAWRRALASDGFLMFTTLGPGSFAGLREVYAEAGWGPPHAALVDMHDLGDMLVEADFAEPVMDQELLRLTYTDPAALLRDLRAWGGNADPQRLAGLRTPRWRRRLESALAARADPDGRIVLEVELVYGHAFTAPPRPRVAAETQIGLEAMREMMRASRGPRREPRR